MQTNNIKEIIEWILCIIIAIVLALLVRHFIFTPTVVKQYSMKPTFEPGNRLILDRWSITTAKDLHRGEIITFEAPLVKEITQSEYDSNNPIAIYDNSKKGIISNFLYYILEINKESYIKRVIGIEGDHIVIKNGKVYLNGEELIEDYLPQGMETSQKGLFYDVVVPNGCIFAMGDNRDDSWDCRAFGCIPKNKIESRVWIRFWPIYKFGNV